MENLLQGMQFPDDLLELLDLVLRDNEPRVLDVVKLFLAHVSPLIRSPSARNLLQLCCKAR